MKKIFHILVFSLMIFILSACAGGNQAPVTSTTSEPSSSATESPSSSEQSATSASSVTEAPSETEEPKGTARRISVQFGENVVIYELNGSTAAASLYEQLPLTIQVEDFSTNEKIFYPPEALDTSDAPLAQAGAGTLAYYAPWGDVVMFYDDYNENPSLFELGQVVSGGELVREMSGTVTITTAE